MYVWIPFYCTLLQSLLSLAVFCPCMPRCSLRPYVLLVSSNCHTPPIDISVFPSLKPFKLTSVSLHLSIPWLHIVNYQPSLLQISSLSSPLPWLNFSSCLQYLWWFKSYFFWFIGFLFCLLKCKGHKSKYFASFAHWHKKHWWVCFLCGTQKLLLKQWSQYQLPGEASMILYFIHMAEDCYDY